MENLEALQRCGAALNKGREVVGTWLTERDTVNEERFGNEKAKSDVR